MNTKTITSRLSVFLIFIALCGGAAVAQVRQSIQVKDYETGQPMAGVEVKCGGQTQTTNAKGLAAFTFAGKAYGDYVNFDITLRKKDDLSIGRDWKSRQLPSDVLTKEPIVLCMMKAGRYYADLERLFDSLFLFSYRDTYLPLWSGPRQKLRRIPAKPLNGPKALFPGTCTTTPGKNSTM